jgi:hypothetical protein
LTCRIAISAFVLVLTLTGCTTAVDIGNGVSRHGDHVYYYDGPEMLATVGTHQADSALGEEWLILAAHFRAASRTGILTIPRDSVALRTPDGRRLPLLTQKQFIAVYGKIRFRLRQAQYSTPSSRTYPGDPEAIRVCDRWFFAEPTAGFTTDELRVNSFELCSGPLVFSVPGGIQPGRWRLLIDLEESTADIPFEVNTG